MPYAFIDRIILKYYKFKMKKSIKAYYDIS
jgi:hypothetical protein